MERRQAIADDQSQPEEHRQPGIAQIALHPLRQVEEAVLEHVGGVDPTLEPRVHAQLDHPPQAVAVPLEKVRERRRSPARSRSTRMNGFTGGVVLELAIPYNCRTAAVSEQGKIEMRPLTPVPSAPAEVVGRHAFMGPR